MHFPRQNPIHRIWKHFEKISWFAFASILLASLLSFGGRFSWLLDSISHFRVQIFQAALLAAGFCLWVRRFKCAGAILCVAAFNYIFILPLYMGSPDSLGSSKPVRAMLLNLNAENHNTDLVLNSIRNADPDILLLAEATPDWAFELSVLATNYPHLVLEPRDDCFGIMLLSKYPLGHEKVVEIGTAGVPSIVTDIYLPDGEISLIGTHPLPPINQNYYNQRNTQLGALPAVVKNQRYPVLLIGDLNVSPWSHWFKKLLKDSGLKNSMIRFGFQPSWPNNNPLLRIPLDHMLHHRDILIHNRVVGGDVGSDHFPVIIDFSLQKD